MRVRRLVPIFSVLVLLRTAPAHAEDPADPARPPDPATSAPDAAAEPAPPQAAPEAATGTGPETGSLERPYWRRNLFGRFFSDQKYLLTTWWPSEFHHPLFTVPLLASTALAISSSRKGVEGPDVEIERRFSDWSDDRNTSWAQLSTRLGDGATGAVFLGATYLIGRWSGHDDLAEASSLSAEALLDVGLYNVVLKGISARTRPSGGATGEFGQYHPSAGESPDSFPSGHAMGAFAVATVFSDVYREHRWVPWVAYGTAGLIGASRVALGRHFPSDVLVGAILGNSLGRMVVTRQGETDLREADRPVSRLAPLVDPTTGGTGMLWTLTW